MINSGHLIWWLRKQLDEDDPASVLADVAAKKAIVDRCEAVLSAPPLPVEGHLALGVLLDLASGYSGRDGYGGWG